MTHKKTAASGTDHKRRHPRKSAKIRTHLKNHHSRKEVVHPELASHHAHKAESGLLHIDGIDLIELRHDALVAGLPHGFASEGQFISFRIHLEEPATADGGSGSHEVELVGVVSGFLHRDLVHNAESGRVFAVILFRDHDARAWNRLLELVEARQEETQKLLKVFRE